MNVLTYIIFYPDEVYISETSNFVLDLFSVLIGSLISLFIALYFFKKEREKENISYDLKLSQYEKYFVVQINSLEKPILHQYDSLVRFCNLLKQTKEGDYNLSITASLTTINLDNISRVSLFEVFVEKRAHENSRVIENYHLLLRQIDYIKDIKPQIIESFRNFTVRKERHDNEWQVGLDGVFRELDNFVALLRKESKSPEHDTFLLEYAILKLNIKNKIREPIDTNYKDMHIVFDEFVTPAIEHTIKNSGDPRSAVMIDKLNACKIAYENIVYLKRNYRLHYLETARNLNHCRLKIKEALNQLLKIDPKYQVKSMGFWKLLLK